MKSFLHPTRRVRLRLTLLAVLALLFQQAALASYVCAGLSMPAGDVAMSAHCDGMPMTRDTRASGPALCVWHCGQVTASTQNLHSLSVPALDLPALPPLSLAWAVPGARISTAQHVPLRSSGIPPALRFRVLLI